MTHFHITWQALLMTLLLSFTALTTTSCGDDEPDQAVIDYYIDVEEEFLINGSTDKTDRYESPIKRMRQAIRSVYPTATATGDDEAVKAACDKEFETYRSMYSGLSEDHFTCLIYLVRATKRGGIVKQSETLRSYVYDLNAPTPGDD